MSLSPIELAAYVGAVSLAASRILTIAQPVWQKLPRWLSIVLPVLVMDLPQVASAFGVVKTGSDLFTAALVSLALIVPGVAAAASNTQPPAT